MNAITTEVAGGVPGTESMVESGAHPAGHVAERLQPMHPVADRPRRRVAALEVTVLAGGPGAEHEISLESGSRIRDALKRLDHNAIMLDIDADDLTALDVPADVLFIALHGVFGEDGALQRILEERGLPYTGTDAEASSIAMDKVRTKAKMIEHGIPTPRFDLIKPARIAAECESISLPVFVKPRASGSSVDTFLVRDRDQLVSALEQVTGRYGAALVEQCIEGPELTVGILADRALPVCEIRTQRDFYDYQAKYLDDDTEYLFDLDLPDELCRRVQELSLKAHKVVGCRDFSRVDWMVDKNTLEPYAIELNTIPGFTSHSLLPKAAARVGISYDLLCQTVIELTMQRIGR